MSGELRIHVNQDKCQGINGPDVTLTVNSG